MQENQVIPFNYGDSLVRTVESKNGEPLWVAKDICDVLGLDNINRAVEKLDDDEKLKLKLLTSGQNRDTICINESGLYTLILRSNKPEAKKFKKWVTSEVLPTIRKTGSYGIQNQDLAPVLNMMMEFMKTQQKYNEMILSQNELVVELLKNVKEKQNNDAKAIHETSYNLSKYIYIKQENRADYITPDQSDKIVELIEKAAAFVAPYHNLEYNTTKRMIFGKFNSKFGVKKYHHLKAVQYDRAVSYLTTLRDKARLETDEGFRYIVDDITDIMNRDEE